MYPSNPLHSETSHRLKLSQHINVFEGFHSALGAPDLCVCVCVCVCGAECS